MAKETSTPIGATIGFTLLLLLVEVAITLISTVIGVISNLINSNNISSPSDLITPPFGLLTLGFKKIYYSDLGYFWCYKRGNSVTIYEQKLLCVIRICKVDYYGDIESLRNRIKGEIESIYEVKLREKHNSNNFKNWDGYIDKKSERDDKLEKLGIK